MLDNPSNEDLKTNKAIHEQPKVVEDKSEREDPFGVVMGNDIKMNEP